MDIRVDRRPNAPSRVQRGMSLALAASWLVACGGGTTMPPGGGGADAAVDGPAGPSWWQPKGVEAKNWDIQLSGTIDVTAARAMYVLDMWSLVPAATMLDYGDGSPVLVPPGALAGKIAELHARTPRTIVVCYVEIGALDLNRPDAVKFPGYDADPKKIPDSPSSTTPGQVKGNPAVNSVIGWSIGTPNLRLLDARVASRARLTPILFKRFDLAKQIGCDAIDPGHSDVVSYESGFLDVGTDSYSFYGDIAKQAHDRATSIGMRNGTIISNQVDMMADKFDWMIVERCGEFDECDKTRPFVNLDKEVFAIDYDKDENGDVQGSVGVCTRQTAAMLASGIFKDVALTNAVRTQCEP